MAGREHSVEDIAFFIVADTMQLLYVLGVFLRHATAHPRSGCLLTKTVDYVSELLMVSTAKSGA